MGAPAVLTQTVARRRDGVVVVREMGASCDGTVVSTMRRHDGTGAGAAGVTGVAVGADAIFSAGGDGALFMVNITPAFFSFRAPSPRTLCPAPRLTCALAVVCSWAWRVWPPRPRATR